MANVSDHLIECDRQPLPKKVRLDNAFEVKTVYAGSLAEAAGIKAGLFLLADEGDRDKAGVENLSSRTGTGPMLTRWADIKNGELVRVLSQGFPFGAELRPSVERLTGHFHSRAAFSEIAGRILEGDEAQFDLLAAAARRSRSSWWPGAVLFRLVQRILLLIFNRQALRRLGSEEKIILAAHAAARGNIRRAKRLLPKNDYDTVFGQGTALASVYYLTEAMIAEGEGQSPNEFTWKLREAYDMSRGSERVARKIAAVTGKAPELTAEPKPRPFPGDYVLLEHDPLAKSEPVGAAEVSLRRTREAMLPGQFVIIVMLGGYRANGFYSPLMESLSQIYPLVGSHFPEVHVITSYGMNGGRANEHWLEGERTALKRGVPVRILHDPNDEMSRLVPTNYSPHCLIVSKSSMIVHEGSLAIEQGIWRAVQMRAGASVA